MTEAFTHPFLREDGTLRSFSEVNQEMAKRRAESGLESWGPEAFESFMIADVSEAEYAEEVELLRSRNRITG